MRVGFLVWGHRLYVSGMNPMLGTAFSILTAAIGVPAGPLVFNVLATLWRSSIRLTASLLAAVGVLLIFVTGGLSGLYNAMAAIDIFVHDTYWVVAHFHFVVGGASVFAIFTGIYCRFPKMFGRRLNETWGRVHVALSLRACRRVRARLRTSDERSVRVDEASGHGARRGHDSRRAVCDRRA